MSWRIIGASSSHKNPRSHLPWPRYVRFISVIRHERTRVGNERGDDSSWNLKQNTTITRRLSSLIKRSVNLFYIHFLMNSHVQWLISNDHIFSIFRERENRKISRSEIDFFLHLKEKLGREEAGKILSLIATKWGPDDLEYRVNTVSSIACLPRTALMAVFAILRYLTNLPFNLPPLSASPSGPRIARGRGNS